MSKQRPARVTRGAAVPAGVLLHGDIVLHAGRELALAIDMPGGWLCRLATESCGTGPSHWLPDGAEVTLVRPYVPPVLATAAAVADPLDRLQDGEQATVLAPGAAVADP